MKTIKNSGNLFFSLTYSLLEELDGDLFREFDEPPNDLEVLGYTIIEKIHD